MKNAQLFHQSVLLRGIPIKRFILLVFKTPKSQVRSEADDEKLNEVEDEVSSLRLAFENNKNSSEMMQDSIANLQEENKILEMEVMYIFQGSVAVLLQYVFAIT